MRHFVPALAAVAMAAAAFAAPSGEDVYKTRCAGCHDQNTARIPSKEALQKLPAARILRTLDFGGRQTYLRNSAQTIVAAECEGELSRPQMVAFEAAVGGGIPIIKALREGLTANQIQWVAGIINGTTNFILSEMRDKGLAFDAVLKEAQRLGYAEADPTFDVGGFDTAHKLSILTSLAFGTEVDADAVYVEGIASIKPLDLVMADELGYRIKLLGVAERTSTGIEQRVHPTMVPKHWAIAQVMGVTNAVNVMADIVGEITLVGPGAGGNATASSVLSDLVDIARGLHVPPLGVSSKTLTQTDQAPMQRHEGGYYIRLTVRDKPGAAAGIATRMAEQQISLESIVQKRPPASRAAPSTTSTRRSRRSPPPWSGRSAPRRPASCRRTSASPVRTSRR